MATDVLVSARVNPAKKELSQRILAAMGASTSDGINRALDYVIANKALPQIEENAKPSAQAFHEFMSRSTLPIEWGADCTEGDYRSVIREGKQARYESLA